MIKHIKTQSTKQKLYRMSMFMALLCCATSLATINEENEDSSNTQLMPTESVGRPEPKTRNCKEYLKELDERVSSLKEIHCGEMNLQNEKYNKMMRLEQEKYDQITIKYKEENESLRKKIHKLLEEKQEAIQLGRSNLDLYKKAERELRILKSLLCFPLYSLSTLAQKICG